ncbi:MAG: HAD hydrolase-like protein, partial [Bacteroidota bacterium]
MKNLNEYKHVIWDWNGTLFNDVELCADIMNNLMIKDNLGTITVDEYRDVFTFPVKKYYELLGHDVCDENWEKISHDFIDEYESRKYEAGLYHDAKIVLDRINQLGISQSVLSAYSQHTLEDLINHFGLSKYFIRLVGLDNIYAASKLDNGKKWMNELGLEKGEVLLIGDTLHDCEVAHEIGADSILLSIGHQSKERLITCEIPLID